MKLNQKHVFITGAARRLGRAMGEHFLPQGVRLSAHYHTSASDAQSLKALAPDRVHLIQGDLRKLDSLPAMVASAEGAFGPIDALILSASLFYPTPVEGVDLPQWRDLLTANLEAPFFLAQAAARSMKPGSSIVMLADINGERSLKNFTPYAVSKGGLLSLTRNLAREWAPRIRVNSLSPGPVLFPENYTEAQRAKSLERTLLGWEGGALSVAQGVQFLLENEYVTGFDLKVDGGRSLMF